MTNESPTPLVIAVQALAIPNSDHSARHDGWTATRQRGFCEALAESGRVDEAALAVGMTRESAYRLRRRAEGRAFAIAWDAALFLARQRMIDDAYELALDGSVETIIKDGKVIAVRRHRDPKMLLAVIDRLASKDVLGSAPTRSVAQEFDTFLDCLESDVARASGASGQFLTERAAWEQFPKRGQLESSGQLLSRDMRRRRVETPLETARLTDDRC